MNAEVQNLPSVARASTAVAEIESSRAVAEAQSMMLVAKKFPRNEVACVDKIMNAFTRPGLAEKAKYQYARGGTSIEGPSIRSLEAIAQLWGNIKTGVRELSRAGGQSEVQAYAVDLESGFFEEKTFTVKHIRDTKQGPKPLTDERDIYEHISNMGARRKRACLEAVIPGDVLDIAMNQADATLRTHAEVTPERIKSLLEKFAEYSVTQDQVEKRIQRRIDSMLPAQMVNLGKIYNSLRDGMSKPADWFDAEDAVQQTKPTLRERMGVDKATGEVKAAQEPAEASTPAPASKTPQKPAPKAGDVRPIPYADVVGMLKRAKNKDQGDVVLDTLNDPSYTEEERAEAYKVYDEKFPKDA